VIFLIKFFIQKMPEMGHEIGRLQVEAAARGQELDLSDVRNSEVHELLGVFDQALDALLHDKDVAILGAGVWELWQEFNDLAARTEPLLRTSVAPEVREFLAAVKFLGIMRENVSGHEGFLGLLAGIESVWRQNLAEWQEQRSGVRLDLGQLLAEAKRAA
jgi:hypothetical protein